MPFQLSIQRSVSWLLTCVVPLRSSRGPGTTERVYARGGCGGELVCLLSSRGRARISFPAGTRRLLSLNWIRHPSCAGPTRWREGASTAWLRLALQGPTGRRRAIVLVPQQQGSRVYCHAMHSLARGDEKVTGLRDGKDVLDARFPRG